MLSGPWSRCIQLDQTGKGCGETACARAVPRSLRCDVENIFDQEVIGDAGLKGIKLLVTRSIQLVHSLQSPQDINVRHALLFRVITRFYVSPSKNRDDVVSFLLVFIPWIGRAPGQRELTVLVKSENQQTIVLLRPVVVAVDMLPQPSVARDDARRTRPVVHVVYKVRDYKRNSGQRIVIRGKVLRESQV